MALRTPLWEVWNMLTVWLLLKRFEVANVLCLSQDKSKWGHNLRSHFINSEWIFLMKFLSLIFISWIIKYSSACQGTQSLVWHLLYGQMTVTEHPRRSIHARRTHFWKDPFPSLDRKSFNLESFHSNSTLNTTRKKCQNSFTFFKNISSCRNMFMVIRFLRIKVELHKLYLSENHLVKWLVYLKMGSKGSNWRKLSWLLSCNF